MQRIEWRDHRGKIASAQNDGRRFRELVNEGKVEVEYRKNHAHYKLKDGYGQPKFRYEQLPNGNVREVPVQQVMQESE